MAPKRKADNDSGIPSGKLKRRQENTPGEDTAMSHGDNANTPNGMCCNCTCCPKCKVNCLSREEFRIMLREELAAAALHRSPRLLSPNLSGGTFEAIQFELVFSNKLKSEYYTEKLIMAEGDEDVRIVLIDARSKSIVTEGPMSSLEIEICVLPGDFGSGSDDQFKDYWSREEFIANIVRPREGRKALLSGDTRITLKGGVAIIPKIKFTDISKRVRTGTFILAAKSKEPNVKEAISKPFVVKDKRGAPIMKHAKPSLNSEIWRLRHIAKGKAIHRQLSAGGIKKVGDFLRHLTINPSLLKERCGEIPEGKWEAIIEHARDCVIGDGAHYVYHAIERPISLAFNSIYEVVKVSFDGQTYRSPETFTLVEKHSVDVAMKEAYENCKDFRALAEDLNELESLQVGQSSNNIPQQVDLSITAEKGSYEDCQDFVPSAVDLRELESPQAGQSSNNGIPQQEVEFSATQQGEEFELDMHGELLICSPYFARCYSRVASPSPSYLDHYGDFDFYAPPSNHGEHIIKRASMWRKIRDGLQWLIQHPF